MLEQSVTMKIASDIMDYIENNNLVFWSTPHEIKRKIPSSFPLEDYYTNPNRIGRGVRYLVELGILEKVSNRRYILVKK
jgi:hypothetical protein